MLRPKNDSPFARAGGENFSPCPHLNPPYAVSMRIFGAPVKSKRFGNSKIVELLDFYTTYFEILFLASFTI